MLPSSPTTPNAVTVLTMRSMSFGSLAIPTASGASRSASRRFSCSRVRFASASSQASSSGVGALSARLIAAASSQILRRGGSVAPPFTRRLTTYRNCSR